MIICRLQSVVGKCRKIGLFLIKNESEANLKTLTLANSCFELYENKIIIFVLKNTFFRGKTDTSRAAM